MIELPLEMAPIAAVREFEHETVSVHELSPELPNQVIVRRSEALPVS